MRAGHRAGRRVEAQQGDDEDQQRGSIHETHPVQFRLRPTATPKEVVAR
jgi:hypothetical protein